MSGISDSHPCPKCNGTMDVYQDWKPYDWGSGECLECGFSYSTVERQMTLEEVNDLRRDLDLPELKQLARQEE